MNRFLIYVILGHFLIFWKLVDLHEIHKWPHFSVVILSLKNQNSKTVIVSHYSFLPWKIYMRIYVLTKGIVRNDNSFWALIFWKILFHNFIWNKKFLQGMHLEKLIASFLKFISICYYFVLRIARTFLKIVKTIFVSYL